MDISGEMMVSKFKRICVLCGSSQGKKSNYQDAANELGKELICDLQNIVSRQCKLTGVNPVSQETVVCTLVLLQIRSATCFVAAGALSIKIGMLRSC
ncbi:hypothetical protein M8C21_023803 [Ambrosia artemisiifolia]|uniref:Uncharacterized protein n=1 Tax=Ambrosia artemisiifolia TaxID=4212 RepID=A0AAD5BV34_AMBAR|nr:hypothetical protein M8C21_023803 [Ambrosia artemisiifolia]